MSNLVERLQGPGRVFSGERLIADVRYDVRVYQNYDETPLLSGERVRTPISQDIELDITESVEAGFGESLTLHMADGRKLEFWGGGRRRVQGYRGPISMKGRLVRVP